MCRVCRQVMLRSLATLKVNRHPPGGREETIGANILSDKIRSLFRQADHCFGLVVIDFFLFLSIKCCSYRLLLED